MNKIFLGYFSGSELIRALSTEQRSLSSITKMHGVSGLYNCLLRQSKLATHKRNAFDFKAIGWENRSDLCW